MSVAIIHNDGLASSFPTSNVQRRQLSTLAFNEGSIVQNFKTADDTFQLTAGQYRFDCNQSGGIFTLITARGNKTGGNQNCLSIDSELEVPTVGIASYQRYDTNAFTQEGSEYFIGTATSTSPTDNYFVFANHGLRLLDHVAFYGSVPPQFTVGTSYGVVFTGIAAADQPNRFKVTDLDTGLIIDFTGSNAPVITKVNREPVRKVDQRPSAVRYKVTVPVGEVYTFSIQNLGNIFGSDGYPHGVTTTIGGITVPSRYLTLRITKTD